ncbi:Bacterial extracellular solute-binding protein [Paenibacillus sp. P1XP2]|nr:Bacterial extracellular solute-binding protein [Paenibacillus sp. P1XP2]
MMKKKMRVLASVFALSMALTTLSACGGKDDKAANVDDPNAKDTITALLPPVSANFQSNFDQMAKEFNEKYPNLTLKIEPASWEDMTQKLDTQVNAGSPPDIAFMGSDGISKYVQQGMLMDISDTATEEMLKDYDAAPLEYMKNGKGLYGFPAIWKCTPSAATRNSWKKPASTTKRCKKRLDLRRIPRSDQKRRGYGKRQNIPLRFCIRNSRRHLQRLPRHSREKRRHAVAVHAGSEIRLHKQKLP